MRFLADINIPQSVITSLILHDHTVIDCKKENLKAKDVTIIERAKQEQCVILTRDKDFIALTQFPKYQVSTIVIRLKNQRPDNILRHILALIEDQNEDTLKQSLTIVTDVAANSYPYKL